MIWAGSFLLAVVVIAVAVIISGSGNGSDSVSLSTNTPITAPPSTVAPTKPTNALITAPLSTVAPTRPTNAPITALPTIFGPDSETKLLASDGVTADQFGTSVAINGKTIVIRAQRELNSNNIEQIYVYTLVGTVWTEQAKLTASDTAGNSRFGASVAIDPMNNTDVTVIKNLVQAKLLPLVESLSAELKQQKSSISGLREENNNLSSSPQNKILPLCL